MNAKPPVSRRRFIALVASAGAAALAAPALAATPEPAPRRKPGRAPAPKPAPKPPRDPIAEQFTQAQASTAATLKVLRAHPLPPGGDLSLVFTPIARRKRSR